MWGAINLHHVACWPHFRSRFRLILGPPSFGRSYLRSWFLCRNWAPVGFLQKMAEMRWAELELTVHSKDEQGQILRKFVLNINTDRDVSTLTEESTQEERDLADAADHIGIGLRVGRRDVARDACQRRENTPECSHIRLEKPNSIPFVRGLLEDRPSMATWESAPSPDAKYGKRYTFEWKFLPGVAV